LRCEITFPIIHNPDIILGLKEAGKTILFSVLSEHFASTEVEVRFAVSAEAARAACHALSDLMAYEGIIMRSV
jgi:hypothetical protein